MMNWGAKPELLMHWQKLGQFRRRYPDVLAGQHRMINAEDYVFAHSYSKNEVNDQVVSCLDLPVTAFSIPLGDLFADGTNLFDAYGQQEYVVLNGKVEVATNEGIVLLEEVD